MPPSRKPQPKDWCDPPEAFGNERETRTWMPPDTTDRTREIDFAAALAQHFWVMHIRDYKTRESTGQAQLFRRDGRLNAEAMWGKRLHGRLPLTARDLAVLVEIVPKAIPSFEATQEFIEVVTAKRQAPKGYRWNRDRIAQPSMPGASPNAERRP